MNKLQHLKEIILAGAIGDAVGYLIEFDSWNKIKTKYGNSGVQLKNLPKDEWVVSDDTQMTLFCLDAITPYIGKKEIDLDEVNEKIYKAYLDWNETQLYIFEMNLQSTLAKYEQLHSKEAPGRTCLEALRNKKMGRMDRKINDSKGCGGIMRVAPIAFLDLSLSDTFKLGAMQAAITHTHTEGYYSAGFFAGLLHCLMNNNTIEESISKNIQELKSYPNHQNMLAYINKIIPHLNNDIILEHDNLVKTIGAGWVGEEALGVALYALCKGVTFEKLIDISINHEGDSDSTGSLAAQLFAAKNGLPPEWNNKYNMLNVNKPMNYLFEKLDLVFNNIKNNKNKI